MLEITGLCKSYGALRVTDHLSINIADGELRAIIGPNGAGKTSLISQIGGELKSDSGAVTFNSHSINALSAPKRCRLGISRTFQISSLFKTLSVVENVRLAAQAHQGHSFRFLADAAKDGRLTEPALAILEKVELAEKVHELALNLSHGDQRRLEIAMALVQRPKLLLLDEPTAGMGANDSANMARLIAGLKGNMSIVLVEHDMSTVFAVADTITVLVNGREIFTDVPSNVRSSTEVQVSYLGDSDDA